MPDHALAPFAAALARLRVARGLTRYALAKAAGLDEIGVKRMERDGREPRLTALVRLADALGCTLDELCGREAVYPATAQPAPESTSCIPGESDVSSRAVRICPEEDRRPSSL